VPLPLMLPLMLMLMLCTPANVVASGGAKDFSRKQRHILCHDLLGRWRIVLRGRAVR